MSQFIDTHKLLVKLKEEYLYFEDFCSSILDPLQVNIQDSILLFFRERIFGTDNLPYAHFTYKFYYYLKGQSNEKDIDTPL
jgi:hypothetical protein